MKEKKNGPVMSREADAEGEEFKYERVI